MARQDTSSGIQNYVVTPSQYTAGTEAGLLVSAASGVNPGFPSPLFPLSTTANPDILYITPSPDIAGSVYDGHPFSIRFAAKFTSAANFSLLVNLYQATNAVLAGGPSSSAYSVVAALTGTGVTKLVTGTSTAANTTSGTFVYEGLYIWDSVSKLLGIANTGTMWQKGVTVAATQSAATVASLAGVNDLNFFPSLTFTTNLPTSFVVTEFVIERV